jgi:hypothetical protein
MGYAVCVSDKPSETQDDQSCDNHAKDMKMNAFGVSSRGVDETVKSDEHSNLIQEMRAGRLRAKYSLFSQTQMAGVPSRTASKTSTAADAFQACS